MPLHPRLPLPVVPPAEAAPQKGARVSDPIKVPAAAVILGAHEYIVCQWARRGLIPAAKIGKNWLFFEDQLREHMPTLRRFLTWSRRKQPLSTNPVNVRRRQRDNERRQEIRPRRAEYFSWHRASRARRTPPWADRAAIRAIYLHAKRESDRLGIEHHVDHIVPLHGRMVCGLHCAANLRVIPAWANRHKGNRA